MKKNNIIVIAIAVIAIIAIIYYLINRKKKSSTTNEESGYLSCDGAYDCCVAYGQLYEPWKGLAEIKRGCRAELENSKAPKLNAESGYGGFGGGGILESICKTGYSCCMRTMQINSPESYAMASAHCSTWDVRQKNKNIATQ